MSLFKELKRRNVFRVGIAYVLMGWVVLQGADFAFDLIDAPNWVIQALSIVVVIGLPFALFFAWAFEVTPEGIKKESDVDRSQSVTNKTGRKLDFLIIGVLVAALAYFVFDKFIASPITVDTRQSTVGADGVTAIEPSIAVLPFADLSQDKDQEYFSDGISEELLNLLVRVDGLKVASRTSSFAYKGSQQGIAAIAADLKVDHVLEGSVRKSGNTVRITAQLIDANTDRHLWSDTFDRELDDIFAIQDEIANAIVQALARELKVAEPLEGITVIAVTDNLDAYEMYLKARQLFQSRNQLDQAIQLFERAIELDPDFVKAWEGLAATELVSSGWLRGDGVDHASAARAAAQRALELDPGLSMPFAVLGSPELNINPDTGEVDTVTSMANMDQAIANDPMNTTAWLWRGIGYLDLGYMDLAVEDLAECLRLDPAYMHCKIHLAAAEIYRGNDVLGMQLVEECMEANFLANSLLFVPATLRVKGRLAAMLMQTNVFLQPYGPVNEVIEAIEYPERDHDESEAKMRRWAQANGVDPALWYQAEMTLFGAFDEIEFEAYDSTWPRGVYWDSAFSRFRQTPGFKSIVRLSGYRHYWRIHGFPPLCRPLGDEDFECD
jgi:TolB-like protein